MKGTFVHGQATVLTETEIKRAFRTIETARHAERNRVAFVLSIYAGLRVGEIASLTIGDVLSHAGDVRREVKLGAHQTKGSKGRAVVLSGRAQRELQAIRVQAVTVPMTHHGSPRSGRIVSSTA